MELTYMVRGADGKEYGPVSLEQLAVWIREGRLAAQQEVKRSDMENWVGAASFSELQDLFKPGADATATAIPQTRPAPLAGMAPDAAIGQLKSGASWFYWVAGLSLINSISALSGSSWRFILGLGVTQLFDAVGNHFGSAAKVVVLALDLIAAGVFVLFGVLAHKRHTWAFVVGMVLFALDGVIFLITQDWIGVGFHVFVLYCFFRGLKACRELH